MKNQKGFAPVVIVLILLVIGVIGYAGYYVYSVQDKKVADTNNSNQTIVKQDNQSTEIEPKSGAYSIDLSGSSKPNQSEVVYAEFSARSSGGGRLIFDESAKKFKTGDNWNIDAEGNAEFDRTKTEDFASTLNASDGTPIYLWKDGDADTYMDTYAIDLTNGKILQVYFKYCSYDDGVNRCEGYMTMEEITAQRAKDIAAVKTFKFK